MRVKNIINIKSKPGKAGKSCLTILVLFFFGWLALAQLTYAQENRITVTGVITDDRGESIIGATVKVVGTTNGTVTDLDGNFSIQAREGADLKITYIGFIEKMIKAGSEKTKIILIEDTKQLGEVVTVGYGAVKRENLLGAVSSISGNEIEDIPAGNLSQTLVGRLAAVSISQTTGRPGATTPLTIRTSGSFSTGADIPLFVINGIVQSSQDAFDMLDPNEIESISILKDAAASIYGARGAGGAVLVTLKKGREGKARISYSGQYGFTIPTSFPNMLSAYDQALLINESLRYSSAGASQDVMSNTASYTPDELEAFKNLNYNWLDASWRNSYQLRNNINVSGGSDKVRYFTSGSMWTETGNFKNIKVNKYTLRSSLEADISKSLTATFELGLSNNKERFPYMVGDNEENMNGFYKMLLSTARWLPYQDGDRFLVNSVNASHNPLGLLNSGSYKSSMSRSTQINASLRYKPEWLPGLTTSIRFGKNLGNGSSRQYVSPYNIWTYGTLGNHGHIIDLNNPVSYSVANSSNERLALGYDESDSYQLNFGINYDKTFGKHNISLLFNYEQSETTGNGSSIRAIDQQIPGLERLEAFNGIDIYSSNLNNSGRIGFIGRINYNYDDKYLFESSFREEASIKFDKNNRWGFFPQVAIGWRISEEPFFKDNVTFMDYLKIRASAGYQGQDNGVGSYEYKFSYNLSNAQYFGIGSDGGNRNGLTVKNNGIVTSGVSWEKTQSLNGGIDTKFLNGSLDFSIDGYFRHTWDIFDQVSVTFTDIVGTSGSSIPKINNGIVNSWGTDIELGYNGVISNNANYYIKGNFSWGDNLIIKKEQDVKWKDTYAWYEGQSTNRGEYGYVTSGIFRTQDQVDLYMTEHPGMVYRGGGTSYTPSVGMLIFEDVARAGNMAIGEPYYVNEPDGIVDEYDIIPIFKKSGTPYAYGLSMGASYKTFRIDMTFTGGFGGKKITNKVERVGPTTSLNVPDYWKDSWTAENPNAKYPSVAYSGLNELPSSFWARSASILRLRTINMSYSVPKEFSNRFGIPSARLFLTGTNILTLWSDFKYKDPSLARYYDYPILRSFNLGLNLSL